MYGNKIDDNQYFARTVWVILPPAKKCSPKRTDKIEVLIFIKKYNGPKFRSSLVTCILFVDKIKGLRYPDPTGLYVWPLGIWVQDVWRPVQV